MIKIKQAFLTPAIEVREALIDGDGSICISPIKKLPQFIHNHAFFWMVEQWIKTNDIPYKVDRTKEPYTNAEGMRVFGKEISAEDWFIQNLE